MFAKFKCLSLFIAGRDRFSFNGAELGLGGGTLAGTRCCKQHGGKCHFKKGEMFFTVEKHANTKHNHP